MASTFCMWPMLAARGNAVFVASPVWPGAAALAQRLPHLSVVSDLVGFDTIRTAMTAQEAYRTRHATVLWGGNCSASPAVIERWLTRRVTVLG